MKKFSLKRRLFGFLFIFLAGLCLKNQSIEPLAKTLIALLTSVGLESLFLYKKNKKWRVADSPLVTGMIIGFVLSSYLSAWYFAGAAFAAITSKHLLRFREKHLFNPAGFGSFLVIVLFNGFTEWKGAYVWLVIIPFGLYFVWKIKRLPLLTAYISVYLLSFGLQAMHQQQALKDIVLYANYFFMLIMLIDPGTTPLPPKRQIAFGSTVALASFLFYTWGFPYSPELPALLVGNLTRFLFNKKK